MNRTLVLALVALAAVPAFTPAFADDSKGFLGATGGVQLQMGGTPPTLVGQFGLTGGYQVASKITVGGTFLFATYGGTPSATIFTFGLQGKYNVVDHLNIGLTLGPQINTSTAPPFPTTTALPWVFGPVVGYDLFIAKNCSVGADVNFLFNTGAFSSPSFFFLGNAKYHF